MFSDFFPENRDICEIMLKNIVDLGGGGTDDVTIGHIRVACWLCKATFTHAHAQAHGLGHKHACTHTHKYIIFITFPRQQ
jgi:hypothetical protein